MKKFVIPLLVVATISWYARPATAQSHRGHRSVQSHGQHRGHHGGYHQQSRHRSHHGGYHHGYHQPQYRSHYRPYAQGYYVQPAPYHGIQLYGQHGGISLNW